MRFFFICRRSENYCNEAFRGAVVGCRKTLHSLSSRNREKVVAQIWKQYHLAS